MRYEIFFSFLQIGKKIRKFCFKYLRGKLILSKYYPYLMLNVHLKVTKNPENSTRRLF